MVVVAGIGDAGFGVWDRAFAATMKRRHLRRLGRVLDRLADLLHNDVHA